MDDGTHYDGGADVDVSLWFCLCGLRLVLWHDLLFFIR